MILSISWPPPDLFTDEGHFTDMKPLLAEGEFCRVIFVSMLLMVCWILLPRVNFGG